MILIETKFIYYKCLQMKSTFLFFFLAHDTVSRRPLRLELGGDNQYDPLHVRG